MSRQFVERMITEAKSQAMVFVGRHKPILILKFRPDGYSSSF